MKLSAIERMKHTRANMGLTIESTVARRYDSQEAHSEVVSLLRAKSGDYTDREARKRNVYAKRDPRAREVATTVIVPEIHYFITCGVDEAALFFLRGLSVVDATTVSDGFNEREVTQTSVSGLGFDVLLGRNPMTREVHTALAQGREPENTILLIEGTVLDFKRGLTHRSFYSHGMLKRLDASTYTAHARHGGTGRSMKVHFIDDGRIHLERYGEQLHFKRIGEVEFRCPAL